LLTVKLAVSSVVVVIDAGLKIVVVRLFIVPFVAEILLHDIFPLVMVVSILICAVLIAIPLIGT
jgi:hypothetical protein